MLSNIPSSDQRLILMRFGNLCAFQRQLAQNPVYGDYFSQKEIEVTKYMLDSVRQHLSMPTRKLALFEPLLHRLPYSWQATYFDSHMEGYDEHISARKVMIKEVIDKAIEEGTSRVIFIKPGFCNRAYISSTTHRDVEHIEIDCPSVMQFKTQFYQSHDLQSFIVEKQDRAVVNQKLHLIQGDITQQTIQDILQKHKFDLTKKTLVIIEALTPYQSKQATMNLLNRDNLGLSEDSEVLAGFMAQPTESQQSFGGAEDDSFYIAYNELSKFINDGSWSISNTFSAFSERTLLPPALRNNYLMIESSPEVYVSMRPRASLDYQNLLELDEIELPSFKDDSPLAMKLQQYHQPSGILDYPRYLNLWPAQQALEVAEPAEIAEPDTALGAGPDLRAPH